MLVYDEQLFVLIEMSGKFKIKQKYVFCCIWMWELLYYAFYLTNHTWFITFFSFHHRWFFVVFKRVVKVDVCWCVKCGRQCHLMVRKKRCPVFQEGRQEDRWRARKIVLLTIRLFSCLCFCFSVWSSDPLPVLFYVSAPFPDLLIWILNWITWQLVKYCWPSWLVSVTCKLKYKTV